MGTWTDKGNGDRTFAMTISKDGATNVIYGDGEHTDSATSELAFAGVENGTNFQNTFEFDKPEWITHVEAEVHDVNHDNNDSKYYNLKFSVAPNEAGQPARLGEITIKYHEQSLKLKVNLEAGAATSYTLYIYDPSKLKTHFSYYRINRGEVTLVPNNIYTIQLYAHSASTENSSIIVELQPGIVYGTNSIDAKFGFTTSTSSPVENLIKYENSLVQDQLEIPLYGFAQSSYSFVNGYAHVKTNTDSDRWGDNITRDSSTFIYLSHMSPYPPIEIYISNMLLRTKIINTFGLYIRNDESGTYDMGNFVIFGDNLLPMLNNIVSIAENKTSNNISINVVINLSNENEENIRLNFNDIAGIYTFFVKEQNSSLYIELEVNENNTYLFAIQHYTNLIGCKLDGGIMYADFDDHTALDNVLDNIVVWTNSQSILDWYFDTDITLKLPTGYKFGYNSDTVTINCTISTLRT